MPAHNHNNLAGTPGASDTAVAGTMSSDNAHSHNYQDAYFAEAGGPGTGLTVRGTSASTDNDNRFFYRRTDGSFTQDPTDPNIQLSTSSVAAHTHTIASNGGNACHNNMQPTLFYGNMFIYGGITLGDIYPYDTRPAPVLI